MAKDSIPTSRLGRSARVGRLAAGEAARQAGTRAANVVRGEEASRAALERRQWETAERIVDVLGTMKGAAMKVGQVLSFMDVGMVPEEHREAFQAKLATLRDAAPTVAFADMRKVIEDQLGGRLRDHFATFDETPIAAASIGQVYRATLHDGREVAVKVQYPRVAEAVRADMQNLGVLLRLAKTVAPGLDVQATATEIRDRIHEELDYELEAANQRAMARLHRGHPFIVIPEVVTELSRERVMVSELLHGRGFDAMRAQPQAARDRLGEVVFRFYVGSMYRHRQFSGDPHPGNVMLLDDGRVAFLDFGLFKHLSPEHAEIELASQRAGHERDAAGLLDVWTRTGFLRHPERFDAETLLQQFVDATWWYVDDEVVTVTPEKAGAVVMDMGDPRSEHFGQMRHETLPADHLLGRRVEILTMAVLAQLGATANWHRIAREWMYGDAPVTELGRAEAAFYGS